MRRRVLILALLVAPVTARAQAATGTTKEQIDQAIAFYKDFQVEAALPILEFIISPAYLQQISPTERVQAYKYIGASYALQNRPDAAITYFRAALDFDPFTDLNPGEFSATEVAPFLDAKRQIFKVAMRPIQSKVVDPRDDTTAYNFQLITTHRGNLRVELLRQSDPSTPVDLLYQGESDGASTIRFRGVLSNGQFADSTTYIIRATARSVLAGAGAQDVTAVQLFRVEHAYAPLEDELPDFAANELLQERIPRRAPWLDLAKGGVMAIAAAGLSYMALNDEVEGRTTHGIAAAGVGTVAAVVSFAYRRQNTEIPEAVRENERRRQQRNLFNAGVRARNEASLQARRIIITPIAGFGQ
ncbi:MAG: tetratricopeptide repeat protein [Gemmatimonadaceae bacterium]